MERQAGYLDPMCPRCGYDQSGEAATWEGACPMEGTCPECGHGFGWADAFRRAPDPFRWSFEHAPGWRGALFRLPRTLLKCPRPSRYWRLMGRSEPVRCARILAMLLVWMLAVRAIWSVPIAVAMAFDWWGNGGFDVISVVRYASWPAAWDFYKHAILGGVERLWIIGVYDSMDSVEFLFIALAPAWISVMWGFTYLVLKKLRFWLRRGGQCGGLGHTARAWLMSLFVVPPLYETMRFFAASQVFFDMVLAMVLMMTMGLSAILWVLLWWSRATRVIGSSWGCGWASACHIVAMLCGLAAHIACYASLERVLY
jgi:hypothetical protein